MHRVIMAVVIGTLASASPVRAQGSDIAACVLARPEQAAFSGAVAITHKGATLISVRGSIAAPGSEPIAASTRFNLGSAGKMFTAIAVGQLVDAGRLQLDDPIGKYVDGLTAEAARVTLRQLLMHTSGLGNFFTPDAVPALQQIKAMRDLMPLIAADRPRFPAGSRFEYSNTGFALLGLAIERASGEDYGDYLRRHIFVPAGMNATALAFEPRSTAVGATSGGMAPRLLPPPGSAGAPPGEARDLHPPMRTGGPAGEVPSAGPLHPAPEASLPATPAGGLYSTAGDLSRFFEALTAGKLLNPDTLQKFTRQQIESAPAKGDLPALYYGLGFGTGDFYGHRWFGHNGGAPGLNAEAIAFPEDDMIIVVLANRDPPSATALFRALREAALRGDCRA